MLIQLAGMLMVSVGKLLVLAGIRSGGMREVLVSLLEIPVGMLMVPVGRQTVAIQRYATGTSRYTAGIRWHAIYVGPLCSL